MKTIYFYSQFIAPKLPLSRIASYFNMHKPLSWKEYIVLKGYHLDLVLKSKTSRKSVYLFQFGCVTFVNFNEGEIRIFLEFMETILDKIDYNLYSRFYESHTLKVLDSGKCRLWQSSDKLFRYNDNVIDIIASVLAQSTALHSIESGLGALLDEAEGFIDHLEKGRMHIDKRKFVKIISRILRFEYVSISGIRIFDRFTPGSLKMQSREVYDALAEYYQLAGRFNIFESKSSELERIVKAYSTLTYKRNEYRLYVFEVFLLALFPLSYVAHYLLEKYGIVDVWKFLFG